MDRWKLVFGACALVLAASFLTFTVTVFCMDPEGAMGGRRREKTTEIKELIARYFVDEYDETALDDAAAAAVVAATGDPWGYYVPAAQYTDFYESKTNSYQGIGVMVYENDDGDCEVTEVRDGSPAEDAGILPGDLLLSADGFDAKGHTIAEIKDVVRGETGTAVHLTMSRDGVSYEVDVMRDAIIHDVVAWDVLDGDVGYVEISNFDENSASQTLAAVDDLLAEGVKGFVFDVRFNPGGEEQELLTILDRILPEGDLFHAVDYSGKETTEESDAVSLDLPMAVLINGDSYSAAEFFAAALQEYDWAEIVGEKTVGKGDFQNVFVLRDGSAVSFSVGKYFTPKGVSLSDTGVTPDVAVSMSDEERASLYRGEMTYEEDRQLQAAIAAVRRGMGK